MITNSKRRAKLTIGDRYTRKDIRSFVGGGSLQSYLLTSKRHVLAACIKPWMNPGAPQIISVGRGPDVQKAGDWLSKQTKPIHLFLKVKRGVKDENGFVRNWRYEGLFQTDRSSTEKEEIAHRGARDRVVTRLVFLSPISTREALESHHPPKPIRIQGRGLTAKQKKAVESRAMQLAQEWLEGKNYEVTDFHDRNPFDFLARRGDDEFVVEVKGTTGSLRKITLTSNEVDLHKERYPKNILLVVSGIVLSKAPLKATRGKVNSWLPWEVDVARLKPLTYEYTVEGRLP